MRRLLKTKIEKYEFIINYLRRMKGLEFIDKDEIDACNLAIRLMCNHLKKI